MKKIIHQFINLYAVWIIASSVLGYIFPSMFAWFSGDLMLGALALVMLGMGLTLRIEDFKELLQMKKGVALGTALQYGAMPLIAWGTTRIMNMPPEISVGFIIVGCCPGGTASNVLTYISRGNLALSVVLTSLSTFIGIFATPLLTEAYAGAYVPVDGWGMFWTSIKVVLLPVLLGVFLNYRFPDFTRRIAVAGPFVSVWAIIFIAGSIVAQSAHIVAEYAGSLLFAASLVHVIGFILGYLVSYWLRLDLKACRTISIEVGMQNGGLAAVLARVNFPLQPLVAVPSVFSSVTQTIIGGLLASYWRWKYRHEDKDVEKEKMDVAYPQPGHVPLIKDNLI